MTLLSDVYDKMTQILISLLVLLFSLSRPTMEGNADFWQSSLAADSSFVTVTHFTDPATAQLIEQSGSLWPKSFVTLPSEIPAGATASEVESLLEIRPGAGQMSYTFQVPQSSLLLPENGATASGGALQFRVANPVPVTPGSFVPTIGGH